YQKPSTNKSPFWIKLLFEPLHHCKISTRLSPYTNTPLQLHRTALYNRTTTHLPGRCAQFGNSLNQTRYGVGGTQLDIKNAITCVCDGCCIKIMTTTDLFKLL